MTEPLKVLLLGGGVFLGRAVVEACLARQHRVTIVCRGKTTRDVPEGVDICRCDRTQSLSALGPTTWDVVVDLCGYHREHIALVLSSLRFAHYCYISSISVYADFDRPPTENAPLRQASPPTELNGTSYGALKVACEERVQTLPMSMWSIVRPGIIVGPHDLSSARRLKGEAAGASDLLYDSFAGRFPYWPARFSMGGNIAMPGLEAHIQVIDVRDLASWLVAGFERDRCGIWNAVGTALTWADLAAAGTSIGPPGTRVHGVPGAVLRRFGVVPHLTLPLWNDPVSAPSLYRVDGGKAWAAGLTPRPLAETVADVAAWAEARHERDYLGTHTLTLAAEAELLRRFRGST